MKPKIISIVGLTASGKSSLGIKIAQEFNGEIISCDSRQIYKGLDIGSAKVTAEEQTMARHHMLDIVEPGITFNVADFQRLAYVAIDDILKRGKLPILVGGSGLYSRSIVDGYGFDSENKPKYDVLQICLMPSKPIIRKQIVDRIDSRLADGMLDETRNLIEKGVSEQWLQSLGLDYYWNVELIRGRVTVEEYKTRYAQKSMQFAKRQRTWFKKEKNTIYLTEPNNFLEDCRKLTAEFLRK